MENSKGISQNKKRFIDFSIEALLGRKEHDWGKVSDTGLQNDVDLVNSHSVKSDTNLVNVPHCPTLNFNGEDGTEKETFAWLSCTRFKPPKLLRTRKKNCIKRNGRGPRIPFSTHQLAILEKTFVDSQYLSGDAITRLADNLNLTETRVKIWFQNRRARFRREKSSAPNCSIRTNCSEHRGESDASKISPQSKHSFRHFINDLNLLAASANSVNRIHLQNQQAFVNPDYDFPLQFTNFTQLTKADHNFQDVT